jgi:hypothetical protein
VRERVLHAAAERTDEAARFLDLLDHFGGRRAEGVRDDAHLRVLEDRFDLRARGRRSPAEQLARVLAGRQLGHAVVAEQLRSEVAMRLRHELLQLGFERRRVEVAPLPLVLARDHDVDAVRLVADVLVDPLHLDLELLRRESHRAEHAEPARGGHRGRDVAAVREGEDRELDAEAFAEGGAHGDLRGRPLRTGVHTLRQK